MNPKHPGRPPMTLGNMREPRLDVVPQLRTHQRWSAIKLILETADALRAVSKMDNKSVDITDPALQCRSAICASWAWSGCSRRA